MMRRLQLWHRFVLLMFVGGCSAVHHPSHQSGTMPSTLPAACTILSRIAGTPPGRHLIAISGRPLARADAQVPDAISTLILSTKMVLTEPGTIVVIIPEDVLQGLITESADRCPTLSKEQNRRARVGFLRHRPEEDDLTTQLQIATSRGTVGRELLDRVTQVVRKTGQNDAVSFMEALVEDG